MLSVAFEFDGVLTVGLVLSLLVCVGLLAWFLSRAVTRKNVTRTIAGQIWNPDRNDSLRLILSTGVEIGPGGYGDGDFTFDYPHGTVPIALRFRGAKVSFCPQCVVGVGGVRKSTQWRVDGEGREHFHDLVLEGVARGDNVECTFSCLEVSVVFPYIHPSFITVAIVPLPREDDTLGVADEDQTLSD